MSTRTWSNRTPWAVSQRMASRRRRLRLARLTDFSGVPRRSLDRVFTSQTTNVCRSTATMSISPSAQRQLRAMMRNPWPARYSAAACSPRWPRSAVARMVTTSGFHDRRGGRRAAWTAGGCGQRRGGRPGVENEGGNVGGAWSTGGGGKCSRTGEGRGVSGPVRERGQNEGPGRGGTWAAGLRQGRTAARVRSGRGLVVGEFEVALGQFLDVDVLERDDADVFDEAGRAVHVPDPGVLHDDLEKDLAIVRVAHVELN